MTFSDNTTRIFWLILEAPGGFSMDVCMRWFGNLSVGWEGYVTGSIKALTGLVALSPGAHAHLHIQEINPRLLYVPLLRLDHLGELVSHRQRPHGRNINRTYASFANIETPCRPGLSPFVCGSRSHPNFENLFDEEASRPRASPEWWDGWF